MARSLVVVESPAKAKTIQKILGKGFEVLSSMGHVKDLPKSRLGVDVENGFTPSYIVIKERKKVLGDILNSARSAATVFLAPDPDREGEAIAWHIAEAIRADAGKKRKGAPKKAKTPSRGKKAKAASAEKEPVAPPIERVLFHEITKKGITDGMAHPRPLDRHKFDAQQARRILDRIVGYTLSPLLWTKVRRGLSAGRVQSVAVKMVCGREKEIAAFVPEEYWSLTARLEGRTPPPFPSKLMEVGGKKVRPRAAAETAALRAAVENGPFVVREVRKKLRRRQAPAPFTTSKLQQEASKALRMQAWRTMMVAQSLYEGVEIPGAGLVGLITYMRTDSVRVADEAMAAVRDHIGRQYGAAYLPETPNVFRNRKSAQDAHEAIRPDLPGISARVPEGDPHPRPVAPLRTDLETVRRFPDGGGRVRADGGRHPVRSRRGARRRLPVPGQRFRAEVRRVSRSVRSRRPGGPGRRRERRDRRGERRCRLQRREAGRERPAAACRG